MAVKCHEAENPRRVGSLARDQPTSPGTRPWSSAGPVRLRSGLENCMRGGSAKAALISVRGSTLEGRKTQESYVSHLGLTRRLRWRTLAWSKTLRSRLTRHTRTSFARELRFPAFVTGLCGVVLNGVRGAASETTNGCARGTRLWRVNPMSGSGMKQGRHAWGGQASGG